MARNPLVTILSSVALLSIFITDAQALTRFDPEDEKSCAITGDNEIYGLGIRVSLYMQWFSSLLATWACPEQIRYARTGTNIVALAVLINTLKGGSNDGGLLVPELFIVTNLVFTLNLFNVPPSTGLMKQSVSSLGAMLLIWCVALFAAPWVWFKNLEQGRREGCAVKLWFIFAPVNVYSKGWGIFFKISSVMEVLTGVACFVGAMLALVYGLYREFSVGGGNRFGDGDDDRLMRTAYKAVVSGLQMITGAIAIAMVERTIKVNGIVLDQEIDESGQLVPLLIGAVTLTSTVWSGLKKLGKFISENTVVKDEQVADTKA